MVRLRPLAGNDCKIPIYRTVDDFGGGKNFEDCCMLKGKEIVLGVTGGIAAYKAVELLRLLTRAGQTYTLS